MTLLEAYRLCCLDEHRGIESWGAGFQAVEYKVDGRTAAQWWRSVLVRFHSTIRANESMFDLTK